MGAVTIVGAATVRLGATGAKGGPTLVGVAGAAGAKEVQL